MSDISITAANVAPGANAVVDRTGIAGAAVTAGQVVYKDATTGRYVLSDANGAAAAQNAGGIALNTAANGQPLAVQTHGDITLGGTIVAGSPYYASATPGAVCPQGDVTTGMAVIQLGLAKSATVLALHIQQPGVTL